MTRLLFAIIFLIVLISVINDINYICGDDASCRINMEAPQ